MRRLVDTVCGAPIHQPPAAMGRRGAPAAGRPARPRPPITSPASAAIALLVVLLVSTPARAQPLEPPPLPFGRVVEVIIEGARRTQPAAVRRVVGTHPGAYLDPDRLRSDLHAIFELRDGASTVFEDARVEVERLDDGLRVIFVVRERPRLDDVVIRFTPGAPDQTAARERFDVRPGHLYDPARVREGERDLEAHYRQAGHALARVVSSLREGAEGSLDLLVDIDPGPVLAVQRVTFTGNRELSDDELAAAIWTRSRTLLTALTRRDRFNPDILADDRRRLELAYRDRGHAEASVAEPEIELLPGEGVVFVAFTVREGPRYRVSGVELSGDLLAPAAELLAQHVHLGPGDWLGARALEADRGRLLAAYREEGYARARVRAEPELGDEPGTAHLRFDIERGPRCVIGRIRISGNRTTSDRVIRRQLRILESDPFRASALAESRERLAQLGPFEEVTIREIVTDRPRVIDLEVIVSERDTLVPGASLGLGTDGSVSLLGQLATPNFLGRGQTLSARAEVGTLRRAVSLSLTDPDVLASGWRLSSRAYWEDLVFPDFSRRSLGVALQAGYPLTRALRASGGLVLEHVDLAADPARQQAAETLGQLFSAGRTVRLLAGLQWDTRDHPTAPRSGFLQQISGALGTSALGSQVGFISLEAASRWFAPLGPLGLRLNLVVGYVLSTDPRRRVPISERFYSGGADTVRGFEPFTLSPTRSVPAEPGVPGSETVAFPIGGNKRLQLNLELGFPLVPALGLEGVAFLDAGNTFEEGEPFTLAPDLLAADDLARSRRLRTSAGFGLRWTVLGNLPLRFEWGFPLAPVPGEPPLVFSVGAGLSF